MHPQTHTLTPSPLCERARAHGRTRTHPHARTHTYARSHMRTQAHVHAPALAAMHAHTRTCAGTDAHTSARMDAHARARARTCTRTQAVGASATADGEDGPSAPADAPQLCARARPIVWFPSTRPTGQAPDWEWASSANAQASAGTALAHVCDVSPMRARHGHGGCWIVPFLHRCIVSMLHRCIAACCIVSMLHRCIAALFPCCIVLPSASASAPPRGIVV